MKELKLFMLLLGCTPKQRHVEQHDVFFSIGYVLKDLIPDIIEFWPEADGNIHIDAWREVTCVDNHVVQILSKQQSATTPKLFFLNLGGYKQNEFEEFHYKMLVACENKMIAIQQAKTSAFYKHTGFAGALSHIDDKYGVDVDDIFEIEDILPTHLKEKYSIQLSPASGSKQDELFLGYFRLNKL